MDEEKLNKLKSTVEESLKTQVAKLQSVKEQLEEDLKFSIGPEREKNEKLLQAATNLLNDMKQAYKNILARDHE